MNMFPVVHPLTLPSKNDLKNSDAERERERLPVNETRTRMDYLREFLVLVREFLVFSRSRLAFTRREREALPKKRDENEKGYFSSRSRLVETLNMNCRFIPELAAQAAQLYTITFSGSIQYFFMGYCQCEFK